MSRSTNAANKVRLAPSLVAQSVALLGRASAISMLQEQLVTRSLGDGMALPANSACARLFLADAVDVLARVTDAPGGQPAAQSITSLMHQKVIQGLPCASQHGALV